VALFALGAHQAVAAEAPVESPVADGSISAAKKSFDTLGKKRTSEDRGADLPKVAAPELSILAPSSSTAKQRQPTQVSKDWLVDGVMGRTTTRADNSSALGPRRSSAGRTDEPEDLLSPEAIKPEAGRPAPRVGEDALGELDPTRGVRPTAAMNPLTNFMSSWISTQDRALLLPSAGSEAGAIRPPSDSITRSFGPSVSNKDLGEAGFLAARTVNAVPRENPFLTADGVGALRQGVEVSAGLLPRPPLPASVRPFDVGLRELSPAAGLVAPSDKPPGPRELGKREDEAKYFRQLKRF